MFFILGWFSFLISTPTWQRLVYVVLSLYFSPLHFSASDQKSNRPKLQKNPKDQRRSDSDLADSTVIGFKHDLYKLFISHPLTIFEPLRLFCFNFLFFPDFVCNLDFPHYLHFLSKKASSATKATKITERAEPTKQAELMNTVALTEQAELMKAVVPSKLS